MDPRLADIIARRRTAVDADCDDGYNEHETVNVLDQKTEQQKISPSQLWQQQRKPQTQQQQQQPQQQQQHKYGSGSSAGSGGKPSSQSPAGTIEAIMARRRLATDTSDEDSYYPDAEGGGGNVSGATSGGGAHEIVAARGLKFGGERAVTGGVKGNMLKEELWRRNTAMGTSSAELTAEPTHTHTHTNTRADVSQSWDMQQFRQIDATDAGHTHTPTQQPSATGPSPQTPAVLQTSMSSSPSTPATHIREAQSAVVMQEMQREREARLRAEAER
jgi:hypothetical protein